ncbi:MAG: B12-binding domain-containing radical SAM protein [Vicinamibacteria bacterium]|nr:B12-binding domain-containing radical SAM protein [Vicinamibacteria bacterium]
MTVRKPVVLFFPSYYSDEAAPPLALIHLAAPLVANGHEVRIVDSAIEDDPEKAVLQALNGACALGVSMVTGPMITQGVSVAAAVRGARPDLPIVAGGWHPSILPEQTLRSPLFDAVVKGQGEITLAEIVDRWNVGERDLSGVTGSLFKRRNEQVDNGPRGYTDINSLPRRPFEIVDFERYANKCHGFRWILYCSSHGCPWDCSYCSNASVYGRNWKPLEADRTVDEMTELAARYALDVVDIIDDNYLVRRDRAVEIAEKLLLKGANFGYFIQTRTDQVDRLTDEELRLLRRSGLKRIFFGIESGSKKVLRTVNKRLDLETAYRTAERCYAAGVEASFNLIFGLPGEEAEDLRDTIAMVDSIGRRNPEAAFFTNIFSPYPGSPIFPEALRLGVQEPTSLEEWASFHPKIQKLPWLQDRAHARVQRIRDYIRIGYSARKMVVHRPDGFKDWVRRGLQRIARFRLRHLAVAFPIEVWALRAWKELRGWFGRREPIVIN